MTFVFAPMVAMTAVYSDGTHQIERIVVGFAAEGPQVLDPREGRTIMVCTDPAAAARPGVEVMGLIARVMDPSVGDDMLPDDIPDVGDLPDDVGDLPAA